MKEIAQRANTSIGTVDRALRNRPGISETTKQKVLAIAEELGYSRNTFASALGRKKSYRIAFLSSKEPHVFYRDINQGFQRAFHELSDYGAELQLFQTEKYNPEEQENFLKHFDYRSFDAVAINVYSGELTPYLNQMVKDGVVVATYNTDAPESHRLFFVGNDSRLSGNIAANLLGDLLGGTGKVSVFSNFAHADSFIQRFRGFGERLHQDYPNINIELWPECHSSSEIAYEIAIERLRKDNTIRGMFAASHSATVGMIKALEESKREDIHLIGYDLSYTVVDALEHKSCSAVLYQDPSQQAYQVIHLLMKYLTGDWIPNQEQFFVETKVVLKSNYSVYLNKNIEDNPFL